MDRYQKVEKPRARGKASENEVRITTQGRIRNYITYAMSLLQEKESGEVVLKAMGRAINKTVMIAELIKRRVVGLHQITYISSTDITDTWEPLEEGLLPLETTRHVSTITITLSKKELDTSSLGYQSPLPADQVKPLTDVECDGDAPPAARGRGRSGRGRGGTRGAINGMMDYNRNGGYSAENGYGGNGRGHGSHGRGRGYGGGDMHGQARGDGRGRGASRSSRLDRPVPAHVPVAA